MPAKSVLFWEKKQRLQANWISVDKRYVKILNFPNKNAVRAEVRIPIRGHNSIRYFDGEIVSLSPEGALCLLNSAQLQVGDKLKFQLISERAGPVQSFEALIVQTNKPISIFRKNHDSGLYYAVQFIEQQEFVLEQIHKWNQAA